MKSWLHSSFHNIYKYLFIYRVYICIYEKLATLHFSLYIYIYIYIYLSFVYIYIYVWKAGYTPVLIIYIHINTYTYIYLFIVYIYTHEKLATLQFSYVCYCKANLCFTPFWSNATCQFTPLLNLHSLIFSLTSFGYLCSITLISTCFTISYGSITLCLLLSLRPLFREPN